LKLKLISRQTLYNHTKSFEEIGISKANLQNLHTDGYESNIIAFSHLLKIRFEEQKVFDSELPIVDFDINQYRPSDEYMNAKLYDENHLDNVVSFNRAA